MELISYERLRQFCRSVFAALGCNGEDADQASEALLAADARGIESHGIARLSGYVRLFDVKRVNPRPHIHVVHETPSTAVVDGDRGMGLVVAPYAMRLAIRKAELVGSGWVSVKNSNHFGIAGYHAMMALSHDMIGYAMTNASALVVPTYASEKMLGTNPIAVAFPAGQEPPLVVDMATSVAANGKLEIRQRKGKSIPTGWAQDEQGCPSTDAYILRKKGSLLPLGGDPEHGSHKGFCLSSIVDIHSAVLSGANFGPWVPPFPAYLPVPEGNPGEGIGHFLGAMRVDGFRSKEAYKKDMDLWIRRFREAHPINSRQKVVIPGDPERENEAKTRKEGIPVDEKVLADIKNLSLRFRIVL